MESCSPSKRRALAPLDANAKPASTLKPRPMTSAPLRLFHDNNNNDNNTSSTVPVASRKRTLDDAAAAAITDATPAKKPCVEDPLPRSPSQSPDTSSLFDASGGDASWATATTDVDVPAPRRVRLTREEARQKAEVLRLRLSLASYKLRTGQTHIPLKDLQQKPLPRPSRVVRVQSPHSSPPREALRSDPISASGEASS